MQVRFYQLTSASLEKVLPKLLEKIYEQRQRILLLCANEEEVKAFNEGLWTYHPTSFLPHGTSKEGEAANQPIWLSSKVETLNGATVCVTVEPKKLEELKRFETIVYLFEAARNAAFIALWKECQNKKIEAIFWQQSAKGEWVQKAAAEIG
jgi:DNA polymerase-3 subunit chi